MSTAPKVMKPRSAPSLSLRTSLVSSPVRYHTGRSAERDEKVEPTASGMCSVCKQEHDGEKNRLHRERQRTHREVRDLEVVSTVPSAMRTSSHTITNAANMLIDGHKWSGGSVRNR